MGKIIDLAEKKMVILLEKGSIWETLDLLRTFGLTNFKMEVLREGYKKGKRTIVALSVWYLNFMLESRLGKGNIIEGDDDQVIKRFKGLKFFWKIGNGPLRWAKDKINQGFFPNFETVFWEIHKDFDPGGGLMSILDEKTAIVFFLDPSQEKKGNENYSVGLCWNSGNGQEFFFVKKSEEIFIFIPYFKGAKIENIIKEAEREWNKKKFLSGAS